MASIEQRSRIVISDRDYKRLSALVEHNTSPAAEALDEELSRADIVEDVPTDAVSMNSRVVFEDLDSGETTTITLVYPHEADAGSMRISVLSPVGSALIGLPVGGSIDWPVSANKTRRLKVVKVEVSEG